MHHQVVEISELYTENDERNASEMNLTNLAVTF